MLLIKIIHMEMSLIATVLIMTPPMRTKNILMSYTVMSPILIFLI